MDDPVLTSTRRSLHAIAEAVLAGPQHRRCGDIRLMVRAGGFCTWPDAGLPVVAVRGTDLVVGTDGERLFPLRGTFGQLGTAAGLDIGPPVGVYPPAYTPAEHEPIVVDPDAAEQIERALAIGDLALRRFAPQQTPVLWPEHFDVAVSVDEVNYGVSPGDTAIAEPYAYVGPWDRPEGPFWNQPFGAAICLRELGGSDEVLGFFHRGQAEAARAAGR
jgi:hypothetical protein